MRRPQTGPALFPLTMHRPNAAIRGVPRAPADCRLSGPFSDSAAKFQPRHYTCRCFKAVEALPGLERHVRKTEQESASSSSTTTSTCAKSSPPSSAAPSRSTPTPARRRRSGRCARRAARRPAARHRPAGHQGLRRPQAHELDARPALVPRYLARRPPTTSRPSSRPTGWASPSTSPSRSGSKPCATSSRRRSTVATGAAPAA